MRTKKAFKNVTASLVNNISISILRLISRTIFIKIIGDIYLGVNGLLSNVLGVLALADLGIGVAINYSLYQPLANKNTEKIKSLMNFYKKAYYIIALVITVAGLILLPFLDYFITGVSVPHMKLYYLIFLANMTFGYLFAHRRTLIIADQAEYKITYIHALFTLLMTIGQIIILVVFKSYILYLFVQTVTVLTEHIVVNRFIKKKYPYLGEKNILPLQKEEKKEINTNVKALMFHKLGGYFVDSTDNIIIAKFLGLVKVGIYSNYFLLLNIINNFLVSGLWSTTSSFGNLNVSEKPKKKLETFYKLNFIGFSVFCVCTICFLNLFNLFIKDFWLGGKYLLGFSTVIVICLNFYIVGLLYVADTIKSSAGLYNKDKFVPIIQGIVNVVASVILVQYYGILGVFIGTTISHLVPIIIKPIIIYKNLFDISFYDYYKKYIKQLVVLIFSGFVSVFILSNVSFANRVVNLLFATITSLIVPVVLILITYFKTEEFRNTVNHIKIFVSKRKDKI